MLPGSHAGPCKLLSFCQPSPELQGASSIHGQLMVCPQHVSLLFSAVSQKNLWLPLQAVPNAAAAPQWGPVHTGYSKENVCLQILVSWRGGCGVGELLAVLALEEPERGSGESHQRGETRGTFTLALPTTDATKMRWARGTAEGTAKSRYLPYLRWYTKVSCP